jgi:hypothetical protein
MRNPGVGNHTFQSDVIYHMCDGKGSFLRAVYHMCVMVKDLPLGPQEQAIRDPDRGEIRTPVKLRSRVHLSV